MWIVCGVFDCYDRQTMKAPEQKRRRLNTGPYPYTRRQHSSARKHASIFGNMANKQHMIGMLSAHLEHAGVAVIHAAEEVDADVVIVRKAMELGEHYDVVVIADDIDTLVLLVYHAHGLHQLYMETKQHTIAIDAVKVLMFAGACYSCMRCLDVTQRLQCLVSERRRPLRCCNHRKNFRGGRCWCFVI